MFIAKNSKRSNSIKTRRDEPIEDKSQIKSKASSSPPTTLELRGVPIHFPFKPYKCQEDYMGKVLDALNSSENALLESPTGTGKTLCLLCSTLAWQQEQGRLLSDSSSGLIHVDADSNSMSNSSSAIGRPSATQPKASKTRVPTIIYASRTHSQLSQVVKEMRFTRYRPKHAVLGSREQMCVHPKVKTAKATSTEINHNCTRLSKERKCRFRNNLDGFVVSGSTRDVNSAAKGEQDDFGMQPILDIEELVDLGKKKKVCPFYLSRGQIADAEIIFVPYNYLFDKDARSNTLSDVNWEDAILVFDEAHNLEAFASESASFDLSSVDIAGCVNEVARAIGYLQAMPEVGEGVKMENLIRLKSIFLQLEQYLENQIAPNGGSFTGEYIFEIFSKGANLNHSNHAIFLKFIKQVSDMIMEMRGGTGGGSSAPASETPKLDHFVGCVKRVFGTTTEGQSFANARAYRVHVSPKTGGQKGMSNSAGGGFVDRGNKSSNGRVFSYWCFAPALAMNELAALNVRSILVTSGTLSPLPSYGLELGIPFPHTLENAHIIGKDQISVKVIGKGVSGKTLTSTYNRRDNAEYISELGNTIISLAKVIPGGVLIFFPSYSVMENCIERWGGPLSSRSRTQSNGKKDFFQARQKRESSSGGNKGRFCFPHSVLGYNQTGCATPWQRLMAVKAIVLEPKTTSELKDVIHEFDKFISMPKSTGCIMIGVCRGKISEGIDFADEKCRAVVITGLPFAPYLDPKVKLKREYLDSIKAAQNVKASGDGGFSTTGNNKNGRTACQKEMSVSLSGAEWYSQQAHRAVNQAIRRVIRHRADYGAILFLDSRFSEARNQQGVSKWIRPSFETDNGVGGAIQSLVKFFRGAKAKAVLNSSQLVAKKQLFIEYEIDANSVSPDQNGLTSAEKVTKIAFVKKVSVSSRDALLQGYVPPNHVIKHVKLDNATLENRKSAQPFNFQNGISKEESARGLAALYKQNRTPSIGRPSNTVSHGISSTIKSAWSEIDQNTTRGQMRSVPSREKKTGTLSEGKSDLKESAQRFFQLAKSTLEPSDFATVRKLLVALKSSGDKKESAPYLQHAQKLISLLLQYDEPSLEGQSQGDVLLHLLHSLLPVAYRLQIEEITCQLKIKKSLLYTNITNTFEPKKDIDILLDILPKLMKKNKLAMVRDISVERSEQSLIRGLQKVINVIMMHNLSGNEEIMKSLYILLPMRLRNVARVLINEAKKKKQMKLLKERDRTIYGEEGINKILFQKATTNHHEQDTVIAKTQSEEVSWKNDSMIRGNALNRQVQEQLSAKLERSKDRVSVMNSKNPYIVKKMKDGKVTKESNSEADHFPTSRPSKRARAMKDVAKLNGKPKSHTDTDTDQMELEEILQEAQSEIFRKATPKIVRINRMLKTNAPVGTECNICGNLAKSFFMAECNHFSCQECWKSWLARSNTCPTCRKPTHNDNLSRVVFEQAVGAGAPSLTQMYATSDDDVDDELEIVSGA